MKLILTISAIAASLLLATSCYNDNEEELYPKTPVTCATDNVAFGAFVSPLINQSCAFSGCHSAASRANGINLGDYTTIKSYITAQKTVF
ncbi:MAG: hypothetical protein HC817_14430 [Saprospiraceae bacterium]|nr:hypothetical protein [Saprospiraceae bacterium]